MREREKKGGEEGRDGERRERWEERGKERKTNWSRDCTLQNPLSTVVVSSTSCGRSHMIPTRTRPVKDYSVLYFDYITQYSVRSTMQQ